MPSGKRAVQGGLREGGKVECKSIVSVSIQLDFSPCRSEPLSSLASFCSDEVVCIGSLARIRMK